MGCVGCGYVCGCMGYGCVGGWVYGVWVGRCVWEHTCMHVRVYGIDMCVCMRCYSEHALKGIDHMTVQANNALKGIDHMTVQANNALKGIDHMTVQANNAYFDVTWGVRQDPPITCIPTKH